MFGFKKILRKEKKIKIIFISKKIEGNVRIFFERNNINKIKLDLKLINYFYMLFKLILII